MTSDGIDIAGTADVQESASGESVVASRFRPISNPATGERIEFTDVAQDNGEEIVRFSWRSMPGGAITEHIHPHQEERFTIIAGEAHFTVNDEERVVGPGETIVVPVGVRHSESNRGSVEIEGVVELRPALHSKEMHEAFAGLGTEGKTTPRGAPKNPLQLGATVWYFRHESRATSPPIWVQDLVLPPLSMLAKVFSVHPYYDRWDTRIPGLTEVTSSAEPLDTRRPSSPTSPVNH